MEKNNIALSDTERNKELFEYEMTEVILKLKGEFAKVSGKDLQLDESQFEIPPINIHSDIPNVDIKPISITSVGVGTTVSGGAFVIPEVVVENSEIDCPAVPTPVIAMPSEVRIEQPVPDCKTVDKIKAYSVKEAEIILPYVSAVVPSVSIKDIPKITVSAIETQSVDTAVKFFQTEITANIEAIRFDIPDVAVDISKMSSEIGISFLPVNVDVDVPAISVNYSPTSIEVKLDSVSDVSVPRVTKFTAHEVSLPNENIQTPKIPKIRKYNCRSIAILDRETKLFYLPQIKTTMFSSINIGPVSSEADNENIQVPKIPKIKKYDGRSIVISNWETKLSDLPKIKAALFSPTTVGPISSEVDVVQVPDMSALPDEEVTVKVEKPKIDFEYPTAKAVKIPAVSLKTAENLEIPVIPDFKPEIQGIIDSVV